MFTKLIAKESSKLFSYENDEPLVRHREFNDYGSPLCTFDGCHRTARNKGLGQGGFQLLCEYHYNGEDVLPGGYKAQKLSYCENVDGRLGYKCTATLIHECQLTVDHINEVHLDNRLENLQTLCASCHNYKSKFYRGIKDWDKMMAIMEENRQKFS